MYLQEFHGPTYILGIGVRLNRHISKPNIFGASENLLRNTGYVMESRRKPNCVHVANSCGVQASVQSTCAAAILGFGENCVIYGQGFTHYTTRCVPGAEFRVRCGVVIDTICVNETRGYQSNRVLLHISNIFNEEKW